MEVNKNGGDTGRVLSEGCGGSRGGGENVSACSVSWSRIAVSEWVFNQGGGRMFARRWRFRRRASHRGILLLCGGFRGLRGPYPNVSLEYLMRSELKGWRDVGGAYVLQAARVLQVFAEV